MKAAVAASFARPGLVTAATDHDNLAVLEAAPGSLGTSSLCHVATKRRAVRLLTLDGNKPSVEALAAGRYPMAKSLHLVAREARDGAVKAFCGFVHGPEAAPLLRANGHLPAADHRSGQAGKHVVAQTAGRVPFQRTVTGLTLALSAAVGLAPRLGHYALSCEREMAALRLEAASSADRITRLARLRPDTWRFEALRLGEMLAPPGDAPASGGRRLVDAAGAVLAGNAPFGALQNPALAASVQVPVFQRRQGCAPGRG